MPLYSFQAVILRFSAPLFTAGLGLKSLPAVISSFPASSFTAGSSVKPLFAVISLSCFVAYCQSSGKPIPTVFSCLIGRVSISSESKMRHGACPRVFILSERKMGHGTCPRVPFPCPTKQRWDKEPVPVSHSLPFFRNMIG